MMKKLGRALWNINTKRIGCDMCNRVLCSYSAADKRQ